MYKRFARSLNMPKRIVVVSGPSGVGKGPIIDNMKKRWNEHHGWGKFNQVKVRKTRTERHKGNEDDFLFDGEGEYIEIDCRGTEQRIYTEEIDKAIDLGQVFPYTRVLIETYHTALPSLKERYGSYPGEIDLCSVFVSPLNSSEIEGLADRLDDYVPDLMLDALVRRSQKEGKAFTRKLMSELETRALDSVDELKDACNYDYVIPNHCYECDSRWGMPELIGEPLEVVESLCMLLAYGKDNRAEDGSCYDLEL